MLHTGVNMINSHHGQVRASYALVDLGTRIVREGDMAERAQLYRIEVLAGGDPLKEERLARSLRDDLVQLDEISVNFASGASDTPGSKSGALTELVLLAAGLTSSKSLASVLTTAISEWCNRGRHRKVRITRGDAALEITGNPDAEQQQLAREFMETFEDDA